MNNDFSKCLYKALIEEVKTPTQAIIKFLQDDIIHLFDRVGNAALVGPMNSGFRPKGKKAILSMDKLYGKTKKSSRSIKFPGSTKIVEIVS